MAENNSFTPELKSWLYRPRFTDSWTECILFDLATWTNGLAFRDIDFSSTGLPVIKIAEIKNGISGQTKFTEAEYESCYLVSPGDMLFSWSGQPETSIDVFWWRGSKGWLNQHIFKVEPNEKECNRLFFYYLLKYLKPHFVLIARNKQTTGLGHVTTRDLKNMKVCLPPLPEQRTIAHILGTLDDKIELNRRMNQTLEAMAQALFKSWFVDFEPFRHQGMQDSPLGEIPVGWRVGRLDEVAVLHRESISPSDYPDEIFYHYSIPAFDEGRTPKAQAGNEIKSNKYQIPNGAVLISKLNPTFPRVWLPFDNEGCRSICSTEFLVVTPKRGLGREYLYSLFCSGGFLATFSTLVTGTSSSHQRVRPEDLMSIDLVIPPGDLIDSYSHKIRPILALASHNLSESNTLAEIRDSLLPKLLSGEIRVKDAEKFVERAL